MLVSSFFYAFSLLCLVRECWLRHGAASVYVYAQHAQVSMSMRSMRKCLCLVRLLSALSALSPPTMCLESASF